MSIEHILESREQAAQELYTAAAAFNAAVRKVYAHGMVADFELERGAVGVRGVKGLTIGSIRVQWVYHADAKRFTRNDDVTRDEAA